MPRNIDYESMADEAIRDHHNAGFKRPRYEVPDPTPMAPPLGYKPAPSIMEQVRDMVRSEQLRAAALSAGAETFEESEDFDVEEYEPSSQWEEQFDPIERLREARLAEAELRVQAETRDAEALELLYARHPNLRPVTTPSPDKAAPGPSPAPKSNSADD